jgi:hypothetical protein
MGRRVVSWSAEASRLRLMPIDSRLYRDVVDSYGGRYPGKDADVRPTGCGGDRARSRQLER